MSLRLLVVSAIVACALARTVPRPQLNAHWEVYKEVHQKKYGPGEENRRRLIWEDNLDFIQKHNLEYDLGLHTYRVGVNSFADLTSKEYRETFLGYRHNRTRKVPLATHQAISLYDLPEHVDWREEGYVTPVKNQGQCGSCWAFSATGSLEGQHFRKTGKLVSLSEQNLVDCDQTSDGCNGGSMDSAFQYVQSNGGIDTESSYPYVAHDEACEFNPSTVGATDKGYHDVESGSEDDLQSAVATVGPVSVAIDASQNSFQFYQSGVYNEPDCSSKSLDHGVLVVGYGTLNDEDYWIVKNSWGEAWGDEGYILMSRNRDNQCGIASDASYPLV